MSSLTILLIGSVIWWVYQVGLNGGFTKMVDNAIDGIAETNTKTEDCIERQDLNVQKAIVAAQSRIDSGFDAKGEIINYPKAYMDAAIYNAVNK